jgi:sugar phosphate isomerase/epimerase
MRARAARDRAKPFDFVDHCHALGLGVVETRLPGTDPEAIQALRRKVESYRMRLILDVGYPRDEAGVPTFEASVKAAKEAGAVSLHAAMTGRRYEDLNSFEEFRQGFDKSQKSITLAEPVLRRHRMRLAIENHKGWRSAEQAAWLKRVNSEWVGVHFDFGNNISLCELPAVTLANLSPYVIACHIKDMAVEWYDEGFLLSEVPLGEGLLDLRGMVATLRRHDPSLPLDLEMITRDPLNIPVFTDKYWATFEDPSSPLPARDFARIVALVNTSKPVHPLPRIAGMTPAAQLQLEDDSIAKSLAYARQFLQ